GKRALPQPGPSRRPAGAHRQGDPATPPPSRVQRAGLRQDRYGVSCRHTWRPFGSQRGRLNLRRARRLPLEEWTPYLLNAPTPSAALQWHAVFGNDQPVELEIGFGKGAFLLAAGDTFPERNFLGVEISRKYQLFTATRLAKRGLRNVRLVKADARTFLR